METISFFDFTSELKMIDFTTTKSVKKAHSFSNISGADICFVLSQSGKGILLEMNKNFTDVK